MNYESKKVKIKKKFIFYIKFYHKTLYLLFCKAIQNKNKNVIIIIYIILSQMVSGIDVKNV